MSRYGKGDLSKKKPQEHDEGIKHVEIIEDWLGELINKEHVLKVVYQLDRAFSKLSEGQFDEKLITSVYKISPDHVVRVFNHIKENPKRYQVSKKTLSLLEHFMQKLQGAGVKVSVSKVALLSYKPHEPNTEKEAPLSNQLSP